MSEPSGTELDSYLRGLLGNAAHHATTPILTSYLGGTVSELARLRAAINVAYRRGQDDMRDRMGRAAHDTRDGALEVWQIYNMETLDLPKDDES